MRIRYLAGIVVAMSACAATSAAISVGVFDADVAGGRGYGERGIYQALSEHPEFTSELFTSITAETLAKYDAVVFANVYEPGEQVDGWQQLLRSYVDGGGGLIVTHNCSAVKCPETFPEIDGGIEKCVGQHIGSFENHPITFGITAFDTAFGDHRIINPGSEAEVLMRNSVDRPAGVAGEVGQGRVARLGPCIGLSAMTTEEAPVGMEARLLFNSVAWAAGTNPWHLPEYGEVTVGISAGAPAFEQPRPVTAHVTVSVRKAAVAVPLRIALYDEAGKEAAATEVIAAGRKEPGRGRYLRVEMDVELPTAGLDDGKHIIMAEGEDVLSVEAPVELRGQIMAADRERTLKARAALQNTTSKFHFNQGFEFDWDRATKTRVLKPELLDAYMARIAESGFETYDYFKSSIWDDQAHEFLEQVCIAAQRHGLKVWATLSPPSGEQEIAAWPKERVREYYYETAERFARLSLKHPNFIAFTCDDFDYNYALFSPEMMAEMARRWRSINPDLYFLPLIYYGGITEEFMATRGPYIDGVVFHFRAGSNPPSYIDNYDPKSFEMYGDVQRYEFKRIRRIVGDKPLIAGLYIWYYEGGWGVMTPDGKKPSEEHIVRDAVQKLQISHDYAIGTRLYGLGIDHAAHQAMGKLCLQWREAGDDWGEADISDLESDIRKYRGELGNPPYFGTLASRPSSLSEDLRAEFGLPHIDLHWRLMETPPRFDPREAVNRFFALWSPDPA